MPYKVKMTVLRREYFQDLADAELKDPHIGKCDKFYEGQEFIIGIQDYWDMLDKKFCSEAWQAVHKYIYTALQGGTPMGDWAKDENTIVLSCIDGVRPVIFKVERFWSDEE